MKKTLLIALASLSLALGTANAQSCCTTQQQNCKPQTCCPSVASSSDADVAKKKKAKAAKNQKLKATQNKVAIVEPK